MCVCVCAWGKKRWGRVVRRSGEAVLAAVSSPYEMGDEFGFPSDMSGPIQDGQSMGTQSGLADPTERYAPANREL